jgi:hypothetical protein
MNILSCGSWNPVQRKFVVRIWLSMFGCVFFSALTAAAFRLWHLKGIGAYLMAVLPALPILGALLANFAYLAEEKDEFQRNLLVQCLLGGIGGTLAVTTIWGYMEDFARAPRLDLMWVYPIFWVFVGIAMPVVYRRYR